MIYLYEDSYKNLIALLVTLKDKKIIPINIKSKDIYQESLFTSSLLLKIDVDKNLKWFNKNVSKNIIKNLYYTYLSNIKDKEKKMYEFFLYYLKYKNNIYNYQTIPVIFEIIKTWQYVLREAHKLKGFLRFRELNNNFLYAKYKSTNNVLPVLARHFKKRLERLCWIIEDEERKNYVIYDMKKIYFLNDKNISKLNLEKKEGEEEIEQLWKAFHKTISIQERKNGRCQMNFMPKKYWDNMLEMEDKL